MAIRKTVSIVTSAYNEEQCIAELARRLSAVFDALPGYDFDVVAVDNGSVDRTYEEFEKVRAGDARWRIVRLARNFGTDGGLTAGLSVVRADAAILMAADLQDPPEMIGEMIARWEAGAANVYGVIARREGVGLLRRINSRLFYATIGKLSDQPIPANANDFRLLDRSAYRYLQEMGERNRFMRGQVAWLGFPSAGVNFERPGRYAGSSKAYSWRVTQFAMRAIFANTILPLMLMPFLGVILFTTSLLALVAFTIDWFVVGVPFPGFGTIVALTVLLFGILVCFLSVLGLYIGLIYEEVRGRPNFVIERASGLDEDAGH